MTWIVRVCLYVLIWCSYYYVITHMKPDIKKVHLLISALGCVVFSCLGIFAIIETVLHIFMSERTWFSFLLLNADSASIMTMELIISYMAADSIIGFLYYHDEMMGLDGYFHHVIYFALLSYFHSVGYGRKLFQIGSSEEIPNFIMRRGQLMPSARDDQLYGKLWLTFRVCLQAAIVVYLCFNTSWTFQSVLLLVGSLAALGLHLYWYNKWKRKYGSVENRDESVSLLSNSEENGMEDVDLIAGRENVVTEAAEEPSPEVDVAGEQELPGKEES